MFEAALVACCILAAALLLMTGLLLWLAPRVWRNNVSRQAALEERLRRVLRADKVRRKEIKKLDEFCAGVAALLEKAGLRLTDAKEKEE